MRMMIDDEEDYFAEPGEKEEHGSADYNYYDIS